MSLQKFYEFREAELRVRDFWEKNKVYKFDPKSKKPIYSCDTPPPTVSGKMHLGHALAYSQADFIMRFQRMQGKNIFYPFGFDDNGLPTERFVEQKIGKRSVEMPRKEFVKLCLEETKEVEKELKENWASLGISPDWNINYRTIDDWCIKTSQRSFIELYKKGREYQKEAPTIWCPECRTAIAQVELEDRNLSSFFNDILFELDNGEKLTIATTRPELLPSCVAVFVHPKDKRYTYLIGQKAKVPLFNFKVPIMTDERADPEKGTGIVMCCTFGDLTDIDWWYAHKLPLKISISKDGKMNELADKYKGMTIKEARNAIIQDLKDALLLTEQKQITHTLNVHERCGTEIEFLVTKQWFIRYLDLKKEFLVAGKKMKWHPSYMRVRYDNWVKGLQWDWCVSRQRYYGVPFPVWYCKKCGAIVIPEDEDLPVDPLEDKPKKLCKCGGNDFAPEQDVLDTWATSSLTPLIATKWREDSKFFKKMSPMSLRSNGHDIITFWLFNTVVKSLLHESQLPWKDIMINGFVLDPKGKKMSKSKGNVIEPLEVLHEYGADCLRFWAASTKLGVDIPFKEKELVAGKRFITKLWNASKFAMIHLKNFDRKKPNKLEVMDKWMLSKLNKLVKECTESFKKYEYSKTKIGVEKFFWHTFCDNYLEIIKDRLYNKKKRGAAAKKSAQYTLYYSLLTILKLMAPIMPYITEEIYQYYFKKKEKPKSIHISDWPEYDKKLEDKKAEKIGDAAIKVIGAVRQFKTKNGKSMKTEVKLALDGKELKQVIEDLKAVTYAKEIRFGEALKISF